MKIKVLLLSLLMATTVSCGGSDIMDTKLTEGNRDTIMQEAMPKMSSEEQKLLLAYIASHMFDSMPDILNGKAKEGDKGNWALLPEGKSLNEILEEQKNAPKN